MASLSAHLRESGDHGQLGFHPACPVCCEERLAGSLPGDVIVGRRAQALVAAGVLAFSGVAPAAVLAATGDQEIVGSTDPSGVSADPEVSDNGPDGSGEVSDDTSASDDDSGPVGPDLAEQADPASGAEATPET